MKTETLFNLYLDVNVFLIVAALVWIAANFVLRRTDLRYCHDIRLRAAYGLLLAVAALPFALLGLDLLVGRQAVSAMSALSLSDFAVAQFLNGRIDLAPSTFEAGLKLRDTMVRDIVGLRSGLGQGIALFLMAGFAFGLVRLLREVAKVRALIREGFLLRRIGRIEIVMTDQVGVPFSTRTWSRQIIVVPTDFLLNAGDLRIAISHELQHIRQGDLSWEVAMECARPFFFWNPAFAFWKREIEARRELACDRQVLVGKNIKLADYADCLLRTCERALHRQAGMRIAVPTVPFAQALGQGSQRVLVARFEMLVRPIKARSAVWTAAVFAPLLAAVFVAGMSIHGSSEWSHDRIMLSTIVNLERLDNRTFVPLY